MTTAIIPPRRSWLPAFTLAVAGGAVVLSLVAITSDDVGSPTAARTPTQVLVRAPEGWGATEAQRQSRLDVPTIVQAPEGWGAAEAQRQSRVGEAIRVQAPEGWGATEAMRRDAQARSAGTADPCAHRLRTSPTC